MPIRRSFLFFLMVTLLLSIWRAPAPATAASPDPLAGDARRPPSRPTLTAAADARPTLAQPSAFMGGRVAVQVIFIESDGGAEPSTENWTPDQIAAIQGHIAAALGWWHARLPNAHLSFDLTTAVVGTRYEPITHDLSAEGNWIGEALGRMGYIGANYFDQAYAADDALRRAHHTDWATTIFVVNSANDADGRFADAMFAYAYIGGPFLVLTSDAGLYGIRQMAPIAAHELGHIFGALDQYASAMTPCTLTSGYLSAPTLNSQLNGCGTHFSSIMLDPVVAYPAGQIDDSALGQIGYRDSDGDSLPDPLDTVPAMQITTTQLQAGSRPVVSGATIDPPYPSLSETPTTINIITRIEYHVDGGAWIALPAADGAYDSPSESITATLPLYDGQHKVDLRAFNSIGAASALASRNVTVTGVGAQPAYAVDAPKLSSSAAITLTLTAPAESSAQISEDPFFAAVAWVPAKANTSQRLKTTEGAHTLYVRFRDSNGLESPPFAQTVMLDSIAPNGQALLHGDGQPWLELEAQDDGSGVTAVEVGNDMQPGAWQPFQPSLPIPPGLTNIQVRFRDAAGNVSAAVPVRNTHLSYLPLVGRP